MIFCCCKDPLCFFLPRWDGIPGYPRFSETFSDIPFFQFHSSSFYFDYHCYTATRAVDRNNDISNFYREQYNCDLSSSPYFADWVIDGFVSYDVLGYNSFLAVVLAILLTPPPSVCGYLNEASLGNDVIDYPLARIAPGEDYMSSDYLIRLNENTYLSPSSTKYYGFTFYWGADYGMCDFSANIHHLSHTLLHGTSEFFHYYPERIVLRDLDDPRYTAPLKEMGFSDDYLLFFHLNYLIRQTFTRGNSQFDGNLRALGVSDTDIALFTAHDSAHTGRYLQRLFQRLKDKK